MHPEEEKGGNGTQEELSEREEQERNGREICEIRMDTKFVKYEQTATLNFFFITYTF